MSASNFISLQKHFLIAMPLANEPFYHAVIYLCEHTENGATGIIINQPLDMSLSDVLEKMKIEGTGSFVKKLPVLLGGPLHPERGFVLHSGNQQWRSTIVIDDSLAVTTSRDVLEEIAKSNEVDHQMLIALGYTGWEAGQLEKELANNLWLSVPATTKILFETPFPLRWKAAAALLGIDINIISNFSGHA